MTDAIPYLGPSWAFPSQGKFAPRWLRYQHDFVGLLIRFLLLFAWQ